MPGGKMIKLTNEKIQKIIEMYLNNYSKVDIAKNLNISTQTVTKYLVKNNIKQKEYFLSKETKDLICKLYTKDNMSIKTIHQKLNVDLNSIKRALHNNNIELRDLSDAQRVYSLNTTYFDIIDTPNKAYILGFLYADGNVSKERYVIQVTLQEEDKHILEKMKQEIGSNKSLYFRESKSKNQKNTYTLSVNNKHMHDSLIKVGVVPQKTFVVKFPEWMKEDLIKHFIRGYFDGDGTFCFRKRPDRKNSYTSVFALTGTNDLCQKIKEYIESKFNIHCCISYCHQKYDSPIRTLSISGRFQCQRIMDWLYEDAEMFLIRKKNKYLNFKNLYNSAC